MPVQTDALQYPYTVFHRNIKHPRLEFRTGTLHVILPHGHDEHRVLKKHQSWIERKYRYIEEAVSISETFTLESKTKEDFRKQVLILCQRYQVELGCVPNRIIIKKMCTKWASCSKKGNLTINSLGRFLHDRLVEYIIFHEMVHLISPDHDPLFWKFLKKRFENIPEIESALCTYWFQIQKVEAPALKTF